LTAFDAPPTIEALEVCFRLSPGLVVLFFIGIGKVA
jgi:hypothetical protein